MEINNYCVSLITPFFLRKVNTEINKIDLINIKFKKFSKSKYLSLKTSLEIRDVFISDNNNNGICERFVENNSNNEIFILKAEKQYKFKIVNNEVVVFKYGYGFLLTFIQLEKDDGKLTTEYITEFLSNITKLKENYEIDFNGNNKLLPEMIRDYLVLDGNDYRMTFIGNDFPDKPEEKPKVFGNISLPLNNDTSLKTLVSNLANNTIDNNMIEDVELLDGIYTAATRNGVFTLSDGLLKDKLSYSNSLNELLLSYLLILNNYYFTGYFYREIKKLSNKLNTEDAGTLSKIIMSLQEEYALYNINSDFVVYTRSDLMNKVISKIKGYFDKDSLKNKIERDLVSLGSILSILKEKQRKKSAKRTSVTIGVATLVVTLVSLLNGLFTLISNIVGKKLSLLLTIIALVFGITLWTVILIFTVKKIKNE